MPWPARISGRLAVLSKFDGAIEFGLVVIDRACASAEGLGAAASQSNSAGSLLRVLGDVDEHRAGTAGLCDEEGFANGARDVFGACRRRRCAW